MSNLFRNFHSSSSLHWGGVNYNQIKLIKSKIKKNKNYKEENTNIKKVPFSLKRVDNVFLKRRSNPCFSKQTQEQKSSILNTLLANLYTSDSNNEKLRSYPSAGKLYSNQIYIYVKNLEGIDEGIYTYNSNYLEEKINSTESLRENWNNAFLNQPYSEDFSIAFVMVLDTEIITEKYGNRGYRYGLIEAGHIAQNILLTAATLGLKSVPVGAFLDYKLSNLLKLNINYELPVYSVFIGAK